MKTLRTFLEESKQFIQTEEEFDLEEGFEDDEEFDEEIIELDDLDDEDLDEEVEELDELSRKTMGSYVRSAVRDVDMKSWEAGREGQRNPGSEAGAAARQKANRRRNGISMAAKKLAREEVETLEEAADVELKPHANGKHYIVHKIHAKSGIGADQMKVGEKLTDTHVDDLNDMGYKVKIHR